MSQASLISGTTNNFFSGLTAEADPKTEARLVASESMDPFHRLLDAIEKKEVLSSHPELKLGKEPQMEEMGKGVDSTEKEEETDHSIASSAHEDQKAFDLSGPSLTSFSAVNTVLTSLFGEENGRIKEVVVQDEVVPLTGGEESFSALRPTDEGNKKQPGHMGEVHRIPAKPEYIGEAVFSPALENRPENLNRIKNLEGVNPLSEEHHRSTQINTLPVQEGLERENRPKSILSEPAFSAIRSEVEPEAKSHIPAQIFSEENTRTRLEGASGFSKASKVLIQEKPPEGRRGDTAGEDHLRNTKVDHNDFQLQSERGNKPSNEMMSRVNENPQVNFQQSNEGDLSGASSLLSGFSKPLLKEAEGDVTRSKQASSKTSSEKILDITSDGLSLKKETEADHLIFRKEASASSGRFLSTSPLEILSPDSVEAEETVGKQEKIALQKASLKGSESRFDQGNVVSKLMPFSGRYSLTPPNEALSADSFVIEKVDEKRVDIALTKSSLDGVESLSDRRQILRQVERHLRSWRPEDGTPIRLQLSPRRLGSLEIEMSIHEKSLSAHILTRDPFVKELLEGNQTFLREGLASQGLKMDQFSVGLGGRGGQAFDQRGGEYSFQKSFSQSSNRLSEQPGLDDKSHTEKVGEGRVNVYI